MAAVTAGRPNRRRSRRIATACAFLSNISLDGNIAKEAAERKTEKSATKGSHESVFKNTDFSSPRPRRTLLHSISEPSTSKCEQGSSKRVANRQRSVTEAISEGKKQESVVVVRRSVSMSESTDSTSSTSGSVHRSKHRISCLMGSSFHHKRRANDKR